MGKFWFREHHYNTQFGHALSWFHFKSIVSGNLRFKDLTWFGHQDDCCDYWISVDSPEAQRAFMLDDDLKLIHKDRDT